MKVKTVIRILFYSGAAAILIPHYWDKIRFGICFAKGALDAEFNLLTGRKVIFVRRYLLDSPRWNGEQWNDTTWVVDSLIFSEFGFSRKECEHDKNLSYFQEEMGRYCTLSSIDYGYGYQSVYNPYVTREFLPRATTEATAILADRPPNWKDALTDQEKKARILFFKP